ncbi:MAG: HD domain-containing protein [Patescibacteria group bacterium]|nr:HD domain-containing protein [Patescibacteria group bacterium]
MDDFPYYSKNEEALFRGLSALPSADQKKIRSALNLAAQYHKGQQRHAADVEHGGYIIHPVRAARWLLEHGIRDADMLIAALLHDTLEDTALTPEDIREQFGNEALSLVQAVTRPRPHNESEADKKTSKPLHYKKLLKMTERVRLIKTADLLDNMRTWTYFTPGHPLAYKLPRWLKEANDYYIPIAASVSDEVVQEMEDIVGRVQDKL